MKRTKNKDLRHVRGHFIFYCCDFFCDFSTKTPQKDA